MSDNAQQLELSDAKANRSAEVDSNESGATDGLLHSIDVELEPLVPSIYRALETRSIVIVLQMWQRIRQLALLPFHLHLRWADYVKNLPLTASVGFVPFGGEDWVNAYTRIYKVRDALAAREYARRERFRTGRYQSNDFFIPDWEQGCNAHCDEIGESVLAGASFLCIDEVRSDGVRERGSRCLLGHLTPRNAHRPFVLVPARRGISEDSARAFAEVDLLIANIQGLRGQRIIQSIQHAIRERGSNRPTLIIASSPSDIIALGLKALLERAQVDVLGTVPPVSEVKVAEVGQDRALAERTFEFAVEELRGKFENDHLVDLAKSAWWATRQSVDEDRFEPELQRFIRILERLAQDDPEAAKLLAHGRDVLCNAAANGELAQARRRAVTNAALHTSGSAGMLVIARGCGVARLHSEIADILEIPAEMLNELGVRIQSHYSTSSENTDVAVVAGYYGLATIDAMMMSRASKLHLILDPVEARAAWYGVQKLISCLKQLGVTDAIPNLEKLASGIADGIPAHLRSHVTDVNISPSLLDPFINSDRVITGGRSYLPSATEDVAIYLTDGTRLDVRLNTRFDVLAAMGGRLRTVSAQALKPGDEIVLLQEDSRALFSEQLMQALDRGVLKEAAAERELWLLIVKLVHERQRTNLRAVTRQMTELGQPVNYATVRSWVTSSDDSPAAIPQQRARFLAFAKAFGINLPEADLLTKFQNIKRWRIGHRAAGRQLARAIRAAYLNRLDAVSQERLKREWGMDAFQLMQSARVATVDEVILPRGIEDAAH